jgi:hypothetical protein
VTTSIFEGWIFDHQQYKAVFETLVEEIERSLADGTPFVFPLLGDSRAGKTALLKDIEAHFASRCSPSGHPLVMFVSMPSAASNVALAIRIIETIIGNILIKGKVHQILDRALKTMQAAGVKVLMVDEMNHLLEKRTTERAQNKEIRQIADWFKELGDLATISMVVAGLPHLSRMYADNDQLQNRGLVGATIHPYAWSVLDEQKQFRETIHAGIVLLEEHGWKIDVSLELLTRVSFLGGGGYIGKARDFLVRIEEVGAKSKSLDVKLVSKAYRDKYPLDAYGDPLELKAIDDVMLNGAHQKALKRALSSGRGK